MRVLCRHTVLLTRFGAFWRRRRGRWGPWGMVLAGKEQENTGGEIVYTGVDVEGLVRFKYVLVS